MLRFLQIEFFEKKRVKKYQNYSFRDFILDVSVKNVWYVIKVMRRI